MIESKHIEILFVEDSTSDAELTIRALRKGGFANVICHVRDGAEALDYLYRRGAFSSRTPIGNPDLILLDLKMPKVSGMVVLGEIKADPALKYVPVVVLTSSKEDPDIQKCYSLGANSYIVKPVQIDSFFQAVKELGKYWLKLSELPRR